MWQYPIELWHRLRRREKIHRSPDWYAFVERDAERNVVRRWVRKWWRACATVDPVLFGIVQRTFDWLTCLMIRCMCPMGRGCSQGLFCPLLALSAASARTMTKPICEVKSCSSTHLVPILIVVLTATVVFLLQHISDRLLCLSRRGKNCVHMHMIPEHHKNLPSSSRADSGVTKTMDASSRATSAAAGQSSCSSITARQTYLSHSALEMPKRRHRSIKSARSETSGTTTIVVPPGSIQAGNWNNMLLPEPAAMTATMKSSPRPMLAMARSCCSLGATSASPSMVLIAILRSLSLSLILRFVRLSAASSSHGARRFESALEVLSEAELSKAENQCQSQLTFLNFAALPRVVPCN